MKWKYNTTVLLIACLIFVFFSQGCDEAINYRIPADWHFAVLRKHRQEGDGTLPIGEGKTIVVVYYPEICGYCLSQIDIIMEGISSIAESKRKVDISLVCVIATKDTATMQYYLDEKMDNVNTIYIDNEGNFKKVFLERKEVFEYPAYFVLEGNNVSIKKRLNDKNSIEKLVSLFSKSLE